MNKVQKFFPFVIFLSIALGVLLGVFLNFPMPEKIGSKNAHKNKLNKLISFIDNEYVDRVDTDSIVDLACSNILEKLDPHSVYVPAAEQQGLSESMKGDFVGIGINFYMYKDSLAVISPLANGPSAKVGILAGDRILQANKTKLFGRKLPSDSVFGNLKGAEGTLIDLMVYRKTTKKTFKVQLRRSIIPIKSVDVSMMINQKTGYIKVNRFAETTFAEFEKALVNLKKQGMKQLVVDLRENGGGYMEEAVEMADEFLKKDALVVFTKNKNGRIDKSFATEKGNFEDGKLFVLIDENSASASEIFAGAIQDNDRGVIVGRRSFGKGLVQREMNFDDGSAVRLTIARYYTPTGRSIQKPYTKGNTDYYAEFDKRFASGELYEKDNMKINDSLKFKTPAGKLVFGGGGIVPDVFVPIEVQKGSEALVYLLESGAMGFFVFEQIDKNRNYFKSLKINDLEQKILLSDDFFVKFESYAQKNGVVANFKINKNLIKNSILAEFKKQLFGEKAFYEQVLKQDLMLKTVLIPIMGIKN